MYVVKEHNKKLHVGIGGVRDDESTRFGPYDTKEEAAAWCSYLNGGLHPDASSRIGEWLYRTMGVLGGPG